MHVIQTCGLGLSVFGGGKLGTGLVGGLVAGAGMEGDAVDASQVIRYY